MKFLKIVKELFVFLGILAAIWVVFFPEKTPASLWQVTTNSGPIYVGTEPRFEVSMFEGYWCMEKNSYEGFVVTRRQNILNVTYIWRTGDDVREVKRGPSEMNFFVEGGYLYVNTPALNGKNKISLNQSGNLVSRKWLTAPYWYYERCHINDPNRLLPEKPRKLNE